MAESETDNRPSDALLDKPFPSRVEYGPMGTPNITYPSFKNLYADLVSRNQISAARPTIQINQANTVSSLPNLPEHAIISEINTITDNLQYPFDKSFEYCLVRMNRILFHRWKHWTFASILQRLHLP